MIASVTTAGACGAQSLARITDSTKLATASGTVMAVITACRPRAMAARASTWEGALQTQASA